MIKKRWLRRLLRVIGVITGLLFILFFVGTQSVDNTPYFETEYYSNTMSNLEAAASDLKESKGEIKAGFARMNITPKIVANPDANKGEFNAIKMAGFGSGKIATGVHDSIFAKAVALQVEEKEVVFVSADMASIAETVILEVEENLKGKLERRQIFFGATHTHSSIGNCMPGFVGETFGGEFQPEVIKWLGSKLTELILAARADKQNAKISSGYTRVPNLVRNRIVGESGRLNDKLDLVSIQQQEGKTAAIGIFSAHATIIGTWNEEYTGDYPGYFQRSLESKGVDLAMFYGGTVGSHSNKGEGEKFKKAEYVGATLADSAAVLIKRMKYDSIASMTTLNTNLQYPELQAFYISKKRRLSTFLGQSLMPELKETYLQGLKLNDLIWLTVPYELSGEYGIDLKNALELEGYNSAITSFNGQYLGYIVPQKYYYFDSYEPRLMGWYGPSMGDYLMELNFKMANTLTGKRL